MFLINDENDYSQYIVSEYSIYNVMNINMQ